MTLALLVLFSHALPLSGFGIDTLETFTHGRHTIGLLSVGLFFALSGFLITGSALRSPSIKSFFWHRFLRIFPAYWICLLICAFAIAPVAAIYEHGSIFLRLFSMPFDSPQAYVLHNGGLLHYHGASIAGVMNIWPASIGTLFSQNSVPFIFNGSLWSLPYEMTCYLAVGGLALAGVLNRKRFVVLTLFAAFWGLYSLNCVHHPLFLTFFPYRAFGLLVMLCAYFTAGSICFLYRERIPCSAALFIASLILATLGLAFGVFGVVAPIALPYAFFWLAFALPIRNFDRRGDFSYGVYLYAFPVEQVLALVGAQTNGFSFYLISSIGITFMFAFLSYRLVEEPCLRLKNLDFATVKRKIFRKDPLVRNRTTSSIGEVAGARAVESAELVG